MHLLTAKTAPTQLVQQLHNLFLAEWGEIDPILGNYPDPILAVDQPDKLAGGLAFTRATKPDFKSSTEGESGIWINAVLVLPAYRKHGVASQLICLAEQNASRFGEQNLFVLSEFPLLYQKLGWSVVTQAGDETILEKCLLVPDA